MKITVDYDTQNKRPMLRISYDAAAATLSEKLLEEFVNLLNDPAQTIQTPVVTETENGVKTIILEITTTM